MELSRRSSCITRFRSRRLLTLAMASLAACGSVCGSAFAADAVTPESLLQEMSDLSRLTHFPSPSYVTKQFSSADPASTTASDPKTWFANEDWDHWHGTVERNGRTERVMMKADGPGAIVRIWSANPEGTLRVYIDGSTTPAIEAPMVDLLSGKVKGLGEPISGLYSKGYNLYLPIPYAKSCEVTTDKKGFYYHVDYRTYEPGTQVTSFKAGDIERLASQIDQQQKLLASPASAVAKPEQNDSFKADVAAGETKMLGTLKGARSINQLRVKVPGDITDAALRSLILRITFDGETTVEAPLGDFFGSAPGLNAYASLPLGIGKDGELYCHWPMPFKESATLEVKNVGKTPVSVSGEIGSSAREWTDGSLHFNAGYHSEYDRASQPPFDWNYLTAAGKGRFVGVAFAIDNPVKDWWGEGDEKIFVDGERQPSWLGTGSEDYYGYAWCWPGLFHHAYHNQTRCDGPANYGRTSVNRFHIMDDIPYTKSFKFDMELWHWKQCNVNMAATTYWYAAPGGKDEFKPITADVEVRPMEAWQPFRVAGAIEGESMKVLEHTATADPQELADLSNEQHMWWRGAKEGDKLVLGFDAPKAGRYKVRGRFVKANDYGIVKLAINDQPVKEPLDFYNPTLVVNDEHDLGTFDLKEGQNTISVTATGTNDKGKHEHMFGLDCIVLTPAQ